MVLRPVAMAVGCAECAAVSARPMKTSLGDYKPPLASAPHSSASGKPK